MCAYFDHAATTPMRPEAVAAMLPFLVEHFGNPSGAHTYARRARQALEEARDVVAACLGAEPGEVVFTSGGTEADNLAIAGVCARRPGPIACTAIEHPAVLRTCEVLSRERPWRRAPVTLDGIVNLDALAELLDPSVSVVSVMLANNEVGTIQPLAEVAALVREKAPEAALHTDAVTAFSWLDVATLASPADLIAVSAHKFGGPKGVGALIVRDGVKMAPLLHGGSQERQRRGGTHNVAGIVAMAAAMTATVAGREATVERVRGGRDRLVDGLRAAVPGATETGRRDTKVAGCAHLCFDGVESEALLILLDEAGVAASAGSACASGALEPSHVLAAMDVPRSLALGALRLTLGATTTEADIDLALNVVPEAVARLRPLDVPSRVPILGAAP